MTRSDGSTPAHARYIMVGGFLGAGKTTAIACLARHLAVGGLRVGLITNDQGSNLVDTASLRARGYATEEIAGGCFCCRFDSLVEAAARLSREARPDVFIAEPVGSCTDLVATVSYPLRRMYGAQFAIAPLSVLVDPVRAARVLGLEPGAPFSDKVLYIYRKQLEEADLILINKCDTLEAARADTLRAALAREFPQASLLEISARTGAGMDAWFARVTGSEQVARAVMDVDYETYAEGEALLGWLNATAELDAPGGFDANTALHQLASDVQARLRAQAAEVAHLKMTLSPEGGLGGEVAVINLVRTDFVPELSARLEGRTARGQLILNLRAEAAPDTLSQAVREACAALSQMAGVRCTLEHLECFRPGKPVPTHRVAG